MNRKAVQILVGAVLLLGWGIWGASAVPTARLDSLVNAPNPFDPRSSTTVISYALAQDSSVTIRLFDLLGESVRTWNLSAGEPGAQAGTNRVEWDGTDERGAGVSSGGYVCHVMAAEDSGYVQGVRKIGVIR